MVALTFIAAFAAIAAVSAKTIVVTVGGNTTANETTVFQPAVILANEGDDVVFNFTQGNHTVTQSTFASPCIPANEANSTINGFNSGFRDAGNESAITILSVPILPDIANQTLWFYDANTCGLGGVGAINVNFSSFQNFDGFVRNAKRLNGTASSSSSSATKSRTASASSTASSSSSSSSSADRAITLGSMSALPLMLAAFLLSL
ncbi:hypothetical protein PLICRDRAFT_48623 [Plicaturopsis crispa FD-325 SS-3]|nr:hypothetical protein PLICRDRAFT_48623 [Plicaturopsis crispa FD-325 SS-3]